MTKSIINPKEINVLNYLSNIESSEVSIQKMLDDLNVDAKTLALSKDPVLSQEIFVIECQRTNFSGSWGVPNPSHTTEYFIGSEIPSKEKIAELKKKEREHRKSQDRTQKNHDYRYQRPSTVITIYNVTTLKKVLKKFDTMPKSSHGSFGSSTYKHIIKIGKIS